MALAENITIGFHEMSSNAVTGKAPVAATVHVYRGAAVAYNTSGYLVLVADDAAQASREIYLATEEADNSSGGDGDIDAHLVLEGVARPPVGALVQADLGKQIHMTDDETLAAAPGANSRILGRLVAITGDGKARIKMGRS